MPHSPRLNILNKLNESGDVIIQWLGIIVFFHVSMLCLMHGINALFFVFAHNHSTTHPAIPIAGYVAFVLFLLLRAHKYIIRTRHESVGNTVQHDMLLTLIATLPDTHTWTLPRPKSVYYDLSNSRHILGIFPRPKTYVDTIGTCWMTTKRSPDAVPRKDGCVWIEITSHEGSLALRASVWVPRGSSDYPPPKAEHSDVEITHRVDDDIDVYTMRWTDPTGVLLGYAASPDSPAYTCAKDLVRAWSDSLARALSHTLSCRREPPLWSARSLSSFQGSYTIPDNSTAYGQASCCKDLRSAHFDTYTRHFASSTYTRVDILGSLAAIVVGILTPVYLCAMHSFHQTYKIDSFHSMALIASIIQSLCVLPFVRIVGNRNTPPIPKTALGTVRSEEILTLDKHTLTSRELTLDLSKPFALNMYRCASNDEALFLVVSVAQGLQNIVWRVRVHPSSWYENLPEFVSNAPVVEGEDFDGWLLPAVFWYQGLHETENSHVVTHGQVQRI